MSDVGLMKSTNPTLRSSGRSVPGCSPARSVTSMPKWGCAAAREKRPDHCRPRYPSSFDGGMGGQVVLETLTPSDRRGPQDLW
jgi:hypothetical protein